ncbi:uncharacterized protein LOC130446142 isoform X2 [Diorhabda sublineata]|uniref:uncharacterized protein LOC130446142 isoform X2 n=1 Tax=Diorhabda sublineata TaxID=1163346 RepID=UPI0024E058C3|nr:uncharacterized protein LOC130446142 isoform X2 [Diorhabda sublineata]
MNNEYLQCKLCSAKSALISLFKGKNKRIRNYIRKIIEITTSIKYEENDYFQCVCYNCIGFTFNMYIFRTKSLENVKKLQTKSLPKNIKKNGIKQLKDIELIDLNQLREIFMNWMQNKRECYSSDTTSSRDTDSHCATTDTNIGVQTDPPIQNSVSCQTFYKNQVSTVDTQTENDYFQCMDNETTVSVGYLQLAATNGHNIIENDQITSIKSSPSSYEFSPSSPQLSDVSISLETTPPPSAPYSLGLVEMTEKAMMLYSCEECDLVMYSKEEVKKHKRNHTQCIFCRRRFRTIQRTKKHFEKCKETSYIPLERLKVPVGKKQLNSPQKKKRKTEPLVEKKKSHKKKK